MMARTLRWISFLLMFHLLTGISSCNDDPTYWDQDDDGWSERKGDCDDTNAAVYPGAEEVCNMVDDDCNNVMDDGLPTSAWYYDQDEDGYGGNTFDDGPVYSCGGFWPFTSPTGDDCNDNDAQTYPEAQEICDGLDQNCDSFGSPQGCDADEDGYFAGYEGIDVDVDCDDADASVYPDRPEECDGKDNDCDGTVDENIEIEGGGVYPSWMCEDGDGDGYFETQGDCDDYDETMYPGHGC